MPLESIEQPWDVVIVGGGFFGGAVALAAREQFPRVVLIEREAELLQRASYSNQARVHNGYHYPRSLLTGLRSSVNFPRFVSDYRSCVDSTIRKLYAVANTHSKVTAAQFDVFCQRIGVPLKRLTGPARRLFNFDLIEEVYEAEEYVFDAAKLKAEVVQRLHDRGVEVRTSTVATQVSQRGDSLLLHSRPTGASSGGTALPARFVFNCTYSNINGLLAGSELPLLPLRHELAEMALVEVPDALKNTGVTVMCGPFFSLMPFPPRGVHTLSHVRYTPHGSWEDRQSLRFDGALDASRFEHRSQFPAMVADARRYMPILESCQQVGSLWEIKTVLPQSEGNDSRPILFKRSETVPGLVSVLGAKIDNIYDLPRELDAVFRSAA
jgi:glycine/D-amino acid oxidase-like deaminating enzyme